LTRPLLTALVVLLAPLAPLACTAGNDNPQNDDTSEPSDGETVVIQRDDRGVAHIRAETDEAAMYGLGYASAEDRLAQMNLYARKTQGRMAEIMGSELIESDKEARLVGYWRHAQEVVETLPAEDQALLAAYAAGVNAWVAAHPDELPPLFAELDFEPEVWTPAHCLVSWYRVSNLFSGTPFNKAKGYYDFKELEAEIGTEAAVEETTANAAPGDPLAGVVQASDVPQEVQDSIYAYAAEHGYGPEEMNMAPDNYGHETAKFSHGWVVAGDRTTTGKAVLVSDPQTPIASPSIWYEWQLTGDTLNVRGIGVAGTPALLLGFNENLAWGLTAAGTGNSDIFRLDMDGDDRRQPHDRVRGRDHHRQGPRRRPGHLERHRVRTDRHRAGLPEPG